MPEDHPAVSVVLPTYDRASTLPDAIDSVLAQTHRPRELVVVDGGSTDGTDEVLASFDDERLRVRRRDEPSGPSAARNAGIRESSGEYVAFVDADDRWRPRKLERQLTAMEGSSASVALCGLDKPTGEPRTRDGASGDVREALLRLDAPTYTSTLVASREALADVGGFDESLPCFEDWELCLRLSAEREFAFVDDALVRKGTDGTNVSADPDRLRAAYERISSRYDLPRTARAQFLADVGITHFEAGRLAAGRPFVRRSLALDPRRPKAALALALAATGSQRAFDVGMATAYRTERLLRASAAALRRRGERALLGTLDRPLPSAIGGDGGGKPARGDGGRVDGEGGDRR